MLLIRVLILQGVLIFQGTISPLAEGTCGLRTSCNALSTRIQGELSHYLHETSVSLMLFSLTILLVVDAFSNVQVQATCTTTSNNLLWYIRRYMAIDSFQRSQIMFNDSFMNQDKTLTISNVSGDAEGSYHCGMSTTPALLCLLVRGRCTGTSHFVLCTSLPSEFAVIFVYCKFSFVQRVYTLGYMLMQYVI